jgi:H+-transporting ATPase
MAERRISYAPDVENGDHSRPDVNEGGALDEYTALNRYISTAQTKRRGSTSSAGAMSAKKEGKKPWYAFWRKAGDGVESGFVCPDEWLETDMRQGLRSSDIEPRRKRTGYNELTTEKTNFFIQFIGYFRGPILYGECFQ